MRLQQYRITRAEGWTLIVGKGALSALPRIVRLTDYSSVTILTDDRVGPLWLDAVRKRLRVSSPQVSSLIIPHGERSKNMRTIEKSLASLHDLGIGRDSLLIALGGGVVGDVAGFIASIYKRGIDYIQIPTSLIALSDSAIGGKTGIDFMGTKNSVGTFYQPRAVICDPQLLGTLPRRELVNGMAEVIKYALIADGKFFKFLSSYTLDDMPWERVISFCAHYKANIVMRDEHDRKGLRALLNFGHTVGHAIEALSDYRIPHGHGVAIGMTAAARISTAHLGLSVREYDRIEIILKKFGLPTKLPVGIKVTSIIQKLGTDKKAEKGRVKWVLLKRIGKAVSGVEIPSRVIKKALEDAR